MMYRIVSDSSSNLFHLDGVDYQTVPLKVITAEGEFADTEKANLNRFREVMKTTKGKTSTSCPNTFEWISCFDGADCIFAITMTGALSGSHNACIQAKEMYLEEHPEANILVIDSLSAGPELILIADKLKELILKNLSFAEICNHINTYMKHTHLLFYIQDLNNLARNGRVSATVAKLAGLLGVRIVGRASETGTLELLHKLRGVKRSILKIVEEMVNAGFAGGKVYIAHANNEEAALELKELIEKVSDKAEVMIHPTAILCSYYVSDQGLMVAYEDKN
ncbi:DegV family protein [Bulleidia sp. zg-1006]|uniref:DegV family protein n=1 Tax=Bulleidia sp. zg-1006 TaxID=2806552 RepID=UPI001939C322|nr:DegV family protein [Bulleidia sp. zg-1006]QRG87380.1 DegV family protein [Bulleidia sp. zg-1006]